MTNEEILLDKLNDVGNFTTVNQEFNTDQREVIYEAMNQVKNNGVLAVVMPRFNPQPEEIEKYCIEKYRKTHDAFGWTGEFKISAKNILDIIIDLQNGA